jgi:hypothetical protein
MARGGRHGVFFLDFGFAHDGTPSRRFHAQTALLYAGLFHSFLSPRHLSWSSTDIEYILDDAPQQSQTTL